MLTRRAMLGGTLGVLAGTGARTMSRELPLDTSGSVTLDGSGNGTVRLTPNVGQKWQINVATVSTTSNVSEPVCRLYRGGVVSAQTLVDGTFTGSGDSTDSLSAVPVTAGVSVFAVWTGGDVGAQATLRVQGTVTVP